MILIDHIDYVQGHCGADGVAYFTDYPLVFRVIWTINILGGLIAPVLLVARSRWALSVAVVAAMTVEELLGLTGRRRHWQSSPLPSVRGSGRPPWLNPELPGRHARVVDTAGATLLPRV